MVFELPRRLTRSLITRLIDKHQQLYLTNVIGLLEISLVVIKLRDCHLATVGSVAIFSIARNHLWLNWKMLSRAEFKWLEDKYLIGGVLETGLTRTSARKFSVFAFLWDNSSKICRNIIMRSLRMCIEFWEWVSKAWDQYVGVKSGHYFQPISGANTRSS